VNTGKVLTANKYLKLNDLLASSSEMRAGVFAAIAIIYKERLDQKPGYCGRQNLAFSSNALLKRSSSNVALLLRVLGELTVLEHSSIHAHAEAFFAGP